MKKGEMLLLYLGLLRYKISSSVRLPISLGMVPEKPLIARSNIFKFDNLPISLRIVPWSSFKPAINEARRSSWNESHGNHGKPTTRYDGLPKCNSKGSQKTPVSFVESRHKQMLSADRKLHGLNQVAPLLAK